MARERRSGRKPRQRGKGGGKEEKKKKKRRIASITTTWGNVEPEDALRHEEERSRRSRRGCQGSRGNKGAEEQRKKNWMPKGRGM